MDYNPFAPAVKENPYPYYAYLRRHAPVYQVEPFGFRAISRYNDVDYVVRNPQIFSSAALFTVMLGDLNPVPEAPSLISSDPPVHTRLRKLVNRAFTPRLISALEPRIREITSQLIAQVPGSEFDLITDLAIPLPVIVIAEMLGVEPDRRGDFKRWSDDIVYAVNMASGGIAEEDRARIRQSIAEFRAHFQNTIEARRQEPREDLISALVRAEEEQQALTADEILGLTTLVLIAGNETTTNLIGNAVLALLDHPAELAKVRADPSLVPNLVEETLRYDTPVQNIFRQTTGDVEMAGTTIPAGTPLLLLYGSANRDERKFPDPDRFDVTRDTQGHLGFGYGIHYCLGAPLARLEGKVALEALLFHLPPWSRKEDSLQRVDSFLVRGVKTLPLRFNTVS
jgi:cytochrome P450